LLKQSIIVVFDCNKQRLLIMALTLAILLSHT